MKKALFGALALVMAATACHNKETEQKLQNSIDSLQSLVNVKDSSMFLLAETMGSIQDNLNAIKEKEGIVSINLNNGESNKEAIQSDIDAINNLLQANKNKVAELTRKLKSSVNKNSELQQIISVLEKQIAQQNEEIQKLNQMLNDKDFEIAGLTNSVINLSKEVEGLGNQFNDAQAKMEKMTNDANVAYYIIGSKRELKKLDVIEGFFTKKLSSDFDESLFTKIDIRETKVIDTNCKSIDIVTSHNENSYELKTDANGLVQIAIKDPAQFWSASKFLVVKGRVQE